MSAWLLVPALPAGADIDDSFHVPRQRVLEQVRTVALTVPLLPPGIPAAASARAFLEELLAGELGLLGFGVVSSQRHEEIWRANAIRLGGLYDPVTATADEKRVLTCHDYTGRELGRLHGADAIAWLRVARAPMPDGWGETIVVDGKPMRRRDVTIRGNYLQLFIFDLSGAPLYSSQSPLEWTHVYLDRGYETREGGQLTRRENMHASVQKVVRDLARAMDKWPSYVPASLQPDAAGPGAAGAAPALER